LIPKTNKGYTSSPLNSVITVNCLNVDKFLVSTHVSSENQHSYNDKFKNTRSKLCFNQEYGDIFQVENTVSLAHCVSADMKMSNGIASIFKQKILQN
jgi:hypothetical protein